MFNRKGQAALEFLTTYGWAFLVILVLIGALAYFGVLSPSKYVPNSCKLNTLLECGGSYAIYDNVSGHSQIKLNIVNNMEDAITMTKFMATEKTKNSFVTNESISPVTLSAHANADVTINFSDRTLTSDFVGQKKSFNVKIYYKKSGSDIEQLAEGTIVTTVQ